MPASTQLAPLAIAAPILVACLLLVIGPRIPRRVVDAIATAAAAGVAALDAALLLATLRGSVVTWSGGWAPSHGFGVGVALVADPVGAGAALTAAVLTLLALVFSWRYFEDAEAHFAALMLLFLAGMTGFALSGDLFNMFVFFELMGAVAYALTGQRIEDPSSVQGALAFGLINSLGAYVTLFGIGLLYSRTGQLGLAPLSVALSNRPADALVAVAFTLVVTGFLVKAAIVPFHLWLDDAHAVAPTPVCVLLSGIMVELGLYGVIRVYTVAFGGVLPRAEVHRAFLVLGTLSAVVGAIMCFAQRHLKRLLAYSTIAHLGLFLVAFSTLGASGGRGALLYAAGHSAIKSALFLMAGVVLNRYGSVDELDLHGRGRDAKLMPWLMLLAALALAGLPPFGTGLGKGIAEESVAEAGAAWALWLFVLASAVTGAAVVRATLRIYFGLGPRPGESSEETAQETSGSREEAEVGSLLQRVPLTMLAPIVALLAVALGLGVVPGVASAFGTAAARYLDGAGYVAQTLGPAGPVPGTADLTGHPAWTPSIVTLGLLSAVLAAGLALLALYRDQLPSWLTAPPRRLSPLLAGLRAVHSGHVGDYVAWLFLGVAALGAFLVVPLGR
ncbi:MAG TPA: complex I subunit 5 family protein [Pseudonocardia sp.]|uniref:complex I subunit 5 family protein n=1 Tax=Pseudonocardia sp. TaxID=60912 RepID=UPI002EDAB1AC